MAKTLIVPSSLVDLKKLKDAMNEGDLCLTRIDAEKDALKDIIETISDELELPKSAIAGLIRHHHKSDIDEKDTGWSDFLELWEAVAKA